MLLFLSLFAFFHSDTLYVDSTGSDTTPLGDSNNCTVSLSPCATISAALSSEVSTDATIHIANTITGSVDINSSASITSEDETITLTYSLPLNYYVYIGSTVSITSTTFSVSFPSNLNQPVPVMKVGPSSSLTLTLVEFNPYSSSVTNCPIIDSQDGNLTLEGTEFSGFNLFDAPLLAVSTKSGCFTMKTYKKTTETSKRNEDDEEVLCSFKSITRKGGNGTVFSLTLDASSSLTLANAYFSSCSLQHQASINAFGGVIYLNVTASSASYSLTNLQFDSTTANSSGSCVYAVLAAAPTTTQADMWKALLEQYDTEQNYYDGIFVLEYGKITHNVYELYSHEFVGSKYSSTTSTHNGTYYYPFYDLGDTKETVPNTFVLYGDSVSSASTALTISANKTLRAVGPSAYSYSNPTINLYYLSSSASLFTVNPGVTFTIHNIKFSVTGTSTSRLSGSDTCNIGTLFTVSGTLVLHGTSFTNDSYRLCFTSSPFSLQSGSSLHLVGFTFKCSYSSNDILLEQVPFFQLSGACTISNALPDAEDEESYQSASISNLYRTYFSSYSSSSGKAAGLQDIVGSGDLAITGLTFSNSYSNDDSSGAVSISLSAGTASLQNCQFSSCYSYNSNGGACAFTVSGGTLNINGATFYYCYLQSSSYSGGAAYIYQTGGTVNLGSTTSNQFSNCYYSSSSSDNTIGGGALYLYISAGTLNIGTTATDIPTTFESCQHSYGGGIFLYIADIAPVITFGRLSFSNCYASNYGRCVYVYATSETWTKSTKYSPTWSTLMTYAEPTPVTNSFYNIHYNITTSSSDSDSIANLPLDTLRVYINYSTDPDNSSSNCTDAANTCRALGSIGTLTNYKSVSYTCVRISFDYLSSNYESLAMTFSHSLESIDGSSKTLYLESSSTNPCFTVGATTACMLTVTKLTISLYSGSFTQSLFKVVVSSTLTLNNVYISGASSSSEYTGYNNYYPSTRLQNSLIDASAGTLNLKDTTFYYLTLASQPLLVVSDNFTLEGYSSFPYFQTTFYRIYRMTGDGTLFNKAVTGSFKLAPSSQVNISNCSSEFGSAGAFAFTVTGSLSLSNLLFYQCYARDRTTTSTSTTCSGGALSISVSGTGSVSLTDLQFSSCSAYTNGGAISLTTAGTSSVLISSSSSYSFSSCSSSGSGGAIYLSTSGESTVTISSSSSYSFSSCYSSNTGGAISLTASDKSSVTISSSFSNCNTYSDGGAMSISTAGTSTVTLAGSSFASCYTDSSYSASTGGALCITGSAGTVIIGAVLTDEDGDTADGSVNFTDCYTTHGDGGAIHLNVTGSDVKIGVNDDVYFSNCSAKMEYVRPAAGATVGNGGAMYVELTSGSLQIGGVAEDEDGTVHFSGCSTPRNYTFGGAYFLRLTRSTPTLTFGQQTFSRSYNSYSQLGETGQGLYVYFTTTVPDYITTNKRFVDLLGFSDEWNKLDTFVAYDETTSKRYQMYAIGSSESLVVDSGEDSDSWYCGIVNPCKTIAGAINNFNRFAITTSTVKFAKESFAVTGVNNITSDGTIEGDETNRSLAVMNVTDARFNIYASVTFKDLSVSFVTYSYSNLFETYSNGTLAIDNVVFSCFSRSYRLNGNCMFETLGGSSISFTKTQFTNLNLSCYLLNLSDSDTNKVGSVSFDGETTFENIYSSSSYPLIYAPSVNDSETTFTLANGVFSDSSVSCSISVILACGTVDIHNNTFESIKSSSDGCLYLSVSGGVAIASNCTFTNCTTSSYGGGAYFSVTNGSLTVRNLTFTECVADRNGGGAYVYVSDGSLKLASLTFTKCLAGGASCCNMSTSAHTNEEKSADDQLTAGGYGGAMVMMLYPLNNAHFSLDMNSLSFSGNNASRGGTTVFVRTDDESILEEDYWDSVIPKAKDASSGQFSYVTTTNRLSQSSLNKKVHPGLSAVAIAGIVIGVVFVIIIVVVIILVFIFVVKPRRGKQVEVAADENGGAGEAKKEQQMEEMPPSGNTNETNGDQ